MKPDRPRKHPQRRGRIGRNINWQSRRNPPSLDVGYLNKDIRKNLSQQVCTFDQIGVTDGALDIQKLIPVDADGAYVGGGEVNIQFKSSLGVLEAAYAYYGPTELNKKQTVAGWYDEDTEELAEYTFASCEGFQVSAGSTCNFQYSGEVNMAETDVPFRKKPINAGQHPPNISRHSGHYSCRWE